MLKIGLTGGIACGKTTAERLFAGHGVPTLDADRIAREMVEPGQPALAAIAQRFGQDILSEGRLDRGRLRRIVFQDPEQKRWLEALLHPRVYAEMATRVSALRAPYCILAVPLLLETGHREWVDRILVVDCPEPEQRRRLRERDGLDETEIDRILAAQATRAERLAAADDVLENRGNSADLAVAVERLHQAYLTLAARR